MTGEKWTSNGVPHGNLSRRRVVNRGGVVEDRNEHVAYSTQPRRSGGGGGGVVEDRNEHVAFGVPSNNRSRQGSTQRSNGSSQRQPRSRGINLRSFSPF